MQILPVLDVLHSGVVRGVAGRRSEYRPLVSSLVTSSDPVAIAAALRSVCGHARLYLADLDAILHRQPNFAIYESLIASGGQLMIDAGVQSAAAALAIAATGADVIAGLETVPEPDTLASLVAAVGDERVTFSLDLLDGHSLGGPGWPEDAIRIVEAVVAAGVMRLIVLDLADVGSSTGGSTFALCREIRQHWPQMRLISGGGIRHREDLNRWSQLGLEAVLVASALHDGRLTAEDVRDFGVMSQISISGRRADSKK